MRVIYNPDMDVYVIFLRPPEALALRNDLVNHYGLPERDI
jgi:hypothetical protein